MTTPEYEATHPMTRQQWRKWLDKNHRIATGVWFTYYKKETGKPGVSYEHAVEEALCFGWIITIYKINVYKTF